MPSVVEGLESHEVGREEGPQNLLPLGKRTEDLGRREGRVQEQPYLDLVGPLPQQGGQDQQVVVVDPDVVLLRPEELHELVHKDPVGLHVCRPLVLLEPSRGCRGERQEVVQQGPQRLLAELVVVPLLQVVAQEDRHVAKVLHERARDRILVFRRDLLGEATHVDHVEFLLEPLARARLDQQGVLVHLEVPPGAVLFLRHGKGQLHRHDDDSGLSCVLLVQALRAAAQAELGL